MTTTYCTHAYKPLWVVDVDGLGRLVCATCKSALTPKPTLVVRPGEVILLFALLVTALIGAAWWTWWLWFA